jgi:hypothetical protein
MRLLSYWICPNGVAHTGACNCVTRPPKWIRWGRS